MFAVYKSQFVKMIKCIEQFYLPLIPSTEVSKPGIARLTLFIQDLYKKGPAPPAESMPEIPSQQLI
jgi:hypothetical protein